MLLDSGAEISFVNTAFVRKVGCVIDVNQKQECVGKGKNVHNQIHTKITLNGSIVEMSSQVGQ